jgi:hypothetical protein
MEVKQMFDKLEEMSIEDLRSLKDEVGETLKAKRIEAKETDSVEKSARDAEMRAALTAGDKVIAKFGKGTVEAVVLRRSEKSVTISFKKDGEDVKKYRKYSEILKIVEKAAKAA